MAFLWEWTIENYKCEKGSYLLLQIPLGNVRPLKADMFPDTNEATKCPEEEEAGPKEHNQLMADQS